MEEEIALGRRAFKGEAINFFIWGLLLEAYMLKDVVVEGERAEREMITQRERVSRYHQAHRESRYHTELGLYSCPLTIASIYRALYRFLQNKKEKIFH